MPRASDRLIVPFSVLASDRTEPFSGESEKATVFCLAELERRKGGGLVLKQPPESMVFIAKAAYPLWLIPFHDTGLVFDGLSATPHVFPHPSVPDMQAFIGNAGRSAGSRETYMAFLAENLNYFQPTSKERSSSIEGLVADPAFLEDFAANLSQVKPIDSVAQETVLMPAAASEETIADEIHDLEDIRLKLTVDVKSLDKGMRLLNSTTKDFVKAIRAEMKQTKEKANAELEKLRGPVEEAVTRIRLKGDEETATSSRKYGKQLLSLEKEKVKLERSKDQVTDRIAKCDAEIKASASAKDEARKGRWKDEKNRYKKERSLLESSTKKIEKEIKETGDDKDQELFRIKSEVEVKVQEARKELDEIEAARDAEIRVLKQQAEKMEEQTSVMAGQIGVVIKSLEESAASLNSLGVRRESAEPSLVYVPFYLIGFHSEAGKRYLHYPPSHVNSVKLLVKLKGALGMAKIKQLFSPQSVALANFLNRIPTMLEENAMLERETSEAAAEKNVLSSHEGEEAIRRGLSSLRDEGWLSEKEYTSFTSALSSDRDSRA